MSARFAIVLSVLAVVTIVPGQAQKSKSSAPETFTANLHVVGAEGGAGAATVQIDVKRYTPDPERTAVESALKTGGYPAFLTALRKAPEVGAVSFGTRRWPIRWARERSTGEYKRTIVLVTDEPIFFVGGGRIDAKPREGYEVALLQLNIDTAGFGTGVMTAAARVKPDGDGGVIVDDYADKPIELTSVTRKIQ